MSSYRSPAARRAEDQGMLVPENCPGMAPGEWIRYWKVLPHSAMARSFGALAPISLDAEGTGTLGAPDSGRLVTLRRFLGIVAWSLFDEKGVEIQWDVAAGEALVDGLSESVLDRLDEVIGKGEPPALGAPADPEKPKGETVGEASAES